MIRWLARRLVVPAPRFLGTSNLAQDWGQSVPLALASLTSRCRQSHSPGCAEVTPIVASVTSAYRQMETGRGYG
jgi:hypothetical protein